MRNLAVVLIFGFIILKGCSPKPGALVDLDGNSYRTIVYGETVWMAENLKVTKSRDGEMITYFYPNGDSVTKEAYGLLYDYKTACIVCPNGWRLPTNEEWEALLKFQIQNEASVYKESNYWGDDPSNNSSRFSVRPAGFGNYGDLDSFFNSKTYLLSRTKDGAHVWTYILEKEKEQIRKASQHPTYGFSIRCVKD